MKIAELQNTLLFSDNDAWRDDAAEDLARLYWHEPQAQQILLDAIMSGYLDESLIHTAAESLAEIWNKLGKVNMDIYRQLSGVSKYVADAFIEQAKIPIE